MRKIIAIMLSLLMIMSATVCAFAEEIIEVGDDIRINYGATNYEGESLNRAFYYFYFTVTEINGDKVTVARDVTLDNLDEFGIEIPSEYQSWVGLLGNQKITVKTTVNKDDLKLYNASEKYDPYVDDKSYQYIIDGSTVAVKFGAVDAYDNDIDDYVNFLDAKVIDVSGNIAIIECVFDTKAFLDELNVKLEGMLSIVVNNLPDDALYNEFELDVPVQELVLLADGADEPIDYDIYLESDTDLMPDILSDTETVTDTESEIESDTESDTETVTDTESDTEIVTDTDTNTLLILGDVSGDNEVTMEDVVSVQKILAKLITYEDLGESAELCADVNTDGKVDLVDVTIIQRYIAKLITALPIK